MQQNHQLVTIVQLQDEYIVNTVTDYINQQYPNAKQKHRNKEVQSIIDCFYFISAHCSNQPDQVSIWTNIHSDYFKLKFGKDYSKLEATQCLYCFCVQCLADLNLIAINGTYSSNAEKNSKKQAFPKSFMISDNIDYSGIYVRVYVTIDLDQKKQKAHKFSTEKSGVPFTDQDKAEFLNMFEFTPDLAVLEKIISAPDGTRVKDKKKNGKLVARYMNNEYRNSIISRYNAYVLKDLYFIINASGRRSTSFNSLPAQLRAKDGYSELDVSNCQPSLLAISTRNVANATGTDYFDQDYFNLCQDGTIYEYLTDQYNRTFGTTYTRDDVKYFVIRDIFFALTNKINSSDICKLFFALFPRVYRYIQDQRSEGKELYFILQSAESKLIRESGITSGIWHLNIYDGFLIRNEDVEAVTANIKAAFSALDFNVLINVKP